jgi:long-chain fatty acid transport protein
MRPTTRIFALGLLAATALAGLPRDAAATNGMNPICYGTDNCGMGGAGFAVTGNAAGAILNPALSGRTGRELLVSVGWLHADVTGQVKDGVAAQGVNNQAASQESGAENFADGTLAINWKFNDQWAVNFSAFPGGGGATEWVNSRTIGYGTSDRQIRTRYFFFEPSVSYTPPQDKTWSFGLGMVISRQDMKTDAPAAVGGAPTPGPKQTVDVSAGAGFHVGVFWQPEGLVTKDLLSIGATYRSRVWAEGYEKYKNTFNQGSMDMPAQWGVGVAVKPLPKWTFAGDIKYIAWAEVPGIGGTEPARGGFGWNNQVVYLVGLAHELTDWFTWRAGYNYGKSPIDENHVFANFLFPATTEHHLTAGVSAKIGPRYEFGASAYWAPEVTLVNNPGGPDAYAQIGGRTTLEHQQYGAQISLKAKF